MSHHTRDGLALGAAMIVVGGSFGALAASAHLPLPRTVAMSVLVFAGGSQFLAVAVAATGALTEGIGFAGWARPAGVALGALAAWRRLPLVVVVLLAAGSTAGLRALGIP